MPTGIYKRKPLTEEHKRNIGKGNKGNKLTEETKKKMSEAKTGDKHPMFGKHPSEKTRRKQSIAKLGHFVSKEIRKKQSEVRKRRKKRDGYINSSETRKKMSESSKGKKLSKEHRRKKSEAMKGNKNPNWKDGISSENAKIRMGIENRLWRESVFAKDNWTCQKYKTKGGILRAHHIYNFAQYPELRFAIDNGITLSKKAHIEFHNKYGYKNNTKEQLIEFLK